ncbi:vitelline envelope sperm lysin receptor [Patella vulgata]|uniref:vitelline envelope sperm lysin receptor n=1 Tax=Patella vulgata TaxID=6465 RepID=UPI0021808CC5|nr:vitelline envelope sperm lysin receptor [Patella vulgata]
MHVHILASIAGLLVSTVYCKLPSTTLNVECGDHVKNTPAVITYIGDAVAVIGYGALAPPCVFKEDISTASFKLSVYYNTTDKCKFQQSSATRAIYGLKVESRLLHQLFESADDERFLIECSFMRYKSNISVDVALQEKYKPAEMVVVPKGTVAKSVFEIYVMSAVGDKRLNEAILVNSLVKLHTHMTTKESTEIGYLPLECVVESSDGKVKILILASGCGTGFPFKQNEGFTMKGPNGDSPKFRMFRISKNQGIVFRCSFVVCTGSCNGNSCVAAKSRKRRSVGLQYNSLGLLTDNSNVKRAAVGVHLPEHQMHAQTNSFEFSKNSMYTAILAVAGIVLIASAVVTAYVLSRIRKQSVPINITYKE